MTPLGESGPTARLATLPNLLTLGRIVLVPVFVWLLLSADGTSAGLRSLALVVFLVAVVTDRLDGDIARRRGQVTDFGKVADPIADKLLLGAAFMGLSQLGEIPWWVTVLVLSREVGVTAIRFVVLRHGVIPAGWGGKLKTFSQSVALSMLVAPSWVLPLSGVWRFTAYLVLAVAVTLTMATGVSYAVTAARLRRAAVRPTPGVVGRPPAR